LYSDTEILSEHLAGQPHDMFGSSMPRHLVINPGFAIP
jgi:hypothetical protein